MRYCHLERTLRDTDALRGNMISRHVEKLHELVKPAAFLPDKVFDRDLDIAERDLGGVRCPYAHLAVYLRSREPGCRRIDKDNAASFMDILDLRVRHGIDEQILRVAPVCNEHLRTVDDVTVPFFSARVFTSVTSLPASGSVMAVPMIASPETIFGR